MNVNEQNKFLSREEAWWFIPEEYCPIFLKLEKEFNKKIGFPISKQQLLEWTDFLKSEQMKHFYGLADKNIITIAELTKAIQDTGDSCKKMSHAKAKVKAEIRNKRYKGYGEILEELETKVIVGHFLSFFENVGILINDDNKNYSFSKVSNHISDYKVPYIIAQIILEHITRDLKHDSASRAVLLEAMHNLIHDPLFDIAIVEKKEDKEVALETVYLDRFNDGLQILKNNGIVKKKKGVTGHYEFIFDIPSGLMSDKDACKAINDNKKRRKAAFDELQQIHARFHQTTSTSKEKVKARLKRALSIISEKLSKIDQLSINDRIIFHWSNVILQCCNHVDFRRFQAFANDVLTYIRYCNIKNAITPITKDALYPWESLYPVWDAIGKVIQNEAKLPIINWPEYVSDIDYQKAVGNILNVINHLIDNNTIEDLYSKRNLDNKTIEQIKIRNEQLISLLYVRSFVEPSSANEYSAHLEHLFKVITSEKNKNYFDLCIIIRHLNLLAINNTFEYASKTKPWEYALKHIPDGLNNFDVQMTLVNIYILLIGLSGNDDTRKKCQKSCSLLFRRLNPQSYEQMIEVIVLRSQYIRWNLNLLSYKEISLLLLEQWKMIGEIFISADENDPRPYVHKYDTLAITIGFLNRYFDFGYSSALLVSQAYIHLKELKINDSLTDYNLLNKLGVLIKKFMPELAVRIAITNETIGYANWSNCQSIADNLLDLGDYNKALEYANKASESYDCNNLGDIQGQTFYLELLLTKVEILLRLGKETEAKRLCLECELKLKELEKLYPKEVRSSLLDSTLARLHRIKTSHESLPYIYRWIRLLYILMAIVEMDSLTPEVEHFFYKWHNFKGLDPEGDESNPEELIEEFKSDSFPSIMEKVAQNIVFRASDINTSTITKTDISKLNKELQKLYLDEQRTFLRIDGKKLDKRYSNRQSLMPTFDMIFDLINPENNTKAFVNQLNLAIISDSNSTISIEEFEKYHYVVMSEWASNEDRLKACQLFTDNMNLSGKSVLIREMAAEVLCEQSILIDCDNWDEKERLLNVAESYIVEQNGTFLSDKAKEIYIRIAHRLCDVYEYRSQEGASSDYSKHALDIVRLYNIRTVDSAWFIGEHAERLMYKAKSQGNTNLLSEAKDLFTESIEILQSVNPQTDDSRHYLELYEEFLSQL